MEKIFADGMIFKNPRQGAPEFIKGSISIKAREFVDFLTKNKAHMSESGWFNIDVKEAKSGKIYCELNTWKPKKQESNGLNSDGSQMPAF